ncbi:MAG: hypothetical protein UU09_C0037G0004 [Microgenomates group bacterium GW2011_GWA2_40_6]|nr:MAG: hypothetical protein UU09_C0037G0004 [Microgenomates group bacterium GW2011_GWA2_40_6]
MNVKEAREIVKGMELSSEALVKIEEILASYGEDKNIPDEIIDKILAIVDVEMDTTRLAGDIYQGGVDMANDYLKKTDEEAGKIADELEKKFPDSLAK